MVFLWNFLRILYNTVKVINKQAVILGYRISNLERYSGATTLAIPWQVEEPDTQESHS